MQNKKNANCAVGPCLLHNENIPRRENFDVDVRDPISGIAGYESDDFVYTEPN